ncbi:MAG: DUF4190 domain-containing protein [Myxococcales bacterium]|nr:DUF4190 domain-containing protein [Myxococcales bacterium]
MKVFCPNCGQANEADPGSRVMCTACTAVFDAPGAAAASPPPPAATPAPAPAQATPWQQPAQPAWQAQPQPYAQAAPAAAGGQKTNVLAIISLVSSVICCAPAGIICGIIALNQIKANPNESGKGLAMAGIIVGGLGMLFWLLSVVGSAGR